MEVPRLGVESELQLPAYATAMQDPNRICNLHHSSWQHRIFNPLSKARGQTCILMVPSQIRFHCAMMGTLIMLFFFFFFFCKLKVVVTVLPASLLVPFSQQHLLISCLYHILAILTLFQAFSLLLYLLW